jgi:autotransporter-associated beta strand protein
MFKNGVIFRRLPFFILVAILSAARVWAQPPQPLGEGIGWAPFPVTFKVQSPTNVPESDRYWATNNIYHTEVFSTDGAFEVGNTTDPRTEQRFEPDYTNGGPQSIGEFQYQSMEQAPSNENSYCIFQLHAGDAESDAFGSTTFMIFWFTNNNGSVWDYSGHEIVGNLGNQWFQVNVDHNLVNHAIKVWINQTLVWTQQDNQAGDFYPKDGCYVQNHNPTLQMDTYVTNILMWTNTGSPLVPLTWTGTTNGLNDSTWNIATETNWINSTNRMLQFYQDAGTTYFNNSDPPGQASTSFILGGSAVTFNDGAPGSTTVNLQGLLQPGGVIVSNNANSYLFTGSGNIGGRTMLLKEDSGSLTDAVANTFTGGVELNGGIINLAAKETAGTSGPLGASGTISFGGGTLQYNTNFIDAADYSSRFSTAADQEYNIDVPITNGANYSSAYSITYATALSSSGGSLTKNGAGSLILSAANTFTGPITVNGGQLRANNLNAFNGNPITEAAAGTQIYLNNAGTYGGTYSITGYGVAESDGITHLGAIRMAAAGIVLSNTITLTGNAGISARASGTTGDAISGQITGGYGIQFGRASTTTSAGGGTITLSNVMNNWTGDTTIADDTLKLGATGVIPSGSSAGNVVLTNAGTAYNAGISNSVFDLNGYSQAINGLSNAVGVTGGTLNMLWVTNSSAAATLTVGSNNATGYFGGIVGGPISLTKTGSGTQTLTGVNTYTGNTTINNGTLALTINGAIAKSPDIIIRAGAILNVTGDGVGGPFTLASGQTLTNVPGPFDTVLYPMIVGNFDTALGTLLLTWQQGESAPLFITNGTLAMSPGTVVKINNTGPALVVGTYTIIGANNGGSVTWPSPPSFMVTGGGIATGATASLQIISGALDLVVTYPTPHITGISISGTTLTMTATNGGAGAQYTLMGSTNMLLPLNQWTPILTNQFDQNGNINLATNIVNSGNPLEFYLLEIP